MDDVTIVAPGDGEIIGDAADRRVELLADHDALAATWSRFGPYRDGADLHVHHRHTDFFYVLAGVLTARLGADGGDVPVEPGTLVRIPPLVVHGFDNRSGEELRYLNFHAPAAGFAAYMRGRRDGVDIPFDQEDPPAGGGRPAAEATLTTEEGAPSSEAGGVRRTVLAAAPELHVARVRAVADARYRLAGDDRIRWLFVLEGEVTVGGRGRAPAGAWVDVPAGVPCDVRVPGAPATLLELSA